MNSQTKRIGDFTWITPSLACGVVSTVAILVAIGWSWSRSLADPNSVSWFVTWLVTAAGIPLAICCAIWSASRYVLSVEVGEDLTFATLLGSQTVSWNDVLGIKFETEDIAIPIPIFPLEIVVDQKWTAVITLSSGRELRGRIKHDDVLIIHDVLQKYPTLDTHLVRALESPRTTMTTFVEGVMEDDLFYASKFLDLSQFDEPTADKLAEPCARKLKDIIDSVWFIDYEEIPDDPDSPSPYILASGSDQEIKEELSPVVQAIKISRETSSGLWRFDSDTVKMIVHEFMDEKDVDKTGQQ